MGRVAELEEALEEMAAKLAALEAEREAERSQHFRKGVELELREAELQRRTVCDGLFPHEVSL